MNRWIPGLLLLGLLTGCPRPPELPPEPEGGERCMGAEDCNESLCGELRACVEGICSVSALRLVPCFDGGASRD
jgi:hypothetical protein